MLFFQEAMRLTAFLELIPIVYSVLMQLPSPASIRNYYPDKLGQQ
jgi:hypothetical protein